MYSIRRVDENQKGIVEDLRKIGASVLVMSSLSKAFDLLVGYQGNNFLFEVKNPKKPKSQRKLTKSQVDLHRSWKGNAQVIETSQDIIDILHRNIGRRENNVYKVHHGES